MKNIEKHKFKSGKINKYQVMINGRNFLVDLGSGLAKHGFFATRFIAASTPDEAELKAVESLRQWEEIKPLLKNKKDDPPMFYLEEIVERGAFKGVNRGIEKGASWYEEKTDEYENI